MPWLDNADWEEEEFSIESACSIMEVLSSSWRSFFLKARLVEIFITKLGKLINFNAGWISHASDDDFLFFLLRD